VQPRIARKPVAGCSLHHPIRHPIETIERASSQASRASAERPLKHNGKRRDERRGMDPDAIDRVVRK